MKAAFNNEDDRPTPPLNEKKVIVLMVSSP